MECPFCGHELDLVDSYGNREGVKGDIFVCVNSHGFDNKKDADEYAKSADILVEDWEDVCCESICNSAEGYFYTDNQGNLYEGYPC